MMRQGPLALVRAAIAGGSLGGLTCALLLRDLGVQVEVYERSPSELVRRGAGIGFLPEAARYLVERAGLHLELKSSNGTSGAYAAARCSDARKPGPK